MTVVNIHMQRLRSMRDLIFNLHLRACVCGVCACEFFTVMELDFTVRIYIQVGLFNQVILKIIEKWGVTEDNIINADTLVNYRNSLKKFYSKYEDKSSNRA